MRSRRAEVVTHTTATTLYTTGIGRGERERERFTVLRRDAPNTLLTRTHPQAPFAAAVFLLFQKKIFLRGESAHTVSEKTALPTRGLLLAATSGQRKARKRPVQTNPKIRELPR